MPLVFVDRETRLTCGIVDMAFPMELEDNGSCESADYDVDLMRTLCCENKPRN
jgi:hypothetical protein